MGTFSIIALIAVLLIWRTIKSNSHIEEHILHIVGWNQRISEEDFIRRLKERGCKLSVSRFQRLADELAGQQIIKKLETDKTTWYWRNTK